MELSEDYLDATWTKDDNGKPQFFIINEAIISKLCILGEDCEPCFEGSQIAKIEFSFEDNFKQQLFSMMNEIKDLLQEGGAKKVFTRYAVEIGDALWSALYTYVESTYPDLQNMYRSVYRIEGIFEESTQKFAVLQSRADMKYYRLNFTLTDETGFVASDTLIEVTKTYTPAEEPQFALEDVEKFAEEYAQKKQQDKDDKDANKNSENKTEDGEEKCPKCDKPLDECECEKEFAVEKCPKCDKPIDECECEKEEDKKYSLEEVVEYVQLKEQFDQLQNDYNTLLSENETLKAEAATAAQNYSVLTEENENLKAQVEPLVEFKKVAERKEKEAMIAQFYMLSDEDKADVVSNIDTYSLDDIESKLSVICVRNKVSFNLDEDKNNDSKVTVYNINSEMDDASTPAWVKAAIAHSEKKN